MPNISQEHVRAHKTRLNAVMTHYARRRTCHVRVQQVRHTGSTAVATQRITQMSQRQFWHLAEYVLVKCPCYAVLWVGRALPRGGGDVSSGGISAFDVSLSPLPPQLTQILPQQRRGEKIGKKNEDSHKNFGKVFFF